MTFQDVRNLHDLKCAHIRPGFLRNMFFVLSSALFFLCWRVHPEMMFLLTITYTMSYLYLVLGFPILKPFLIGLAISFAFLSFYNDLYRYNTMKMTFFSYSLFPLFAWPMGLTLLSYVTSFANSRLGIKTYFRKTLFSFLLYVPFLIAVEYAGYHLGNVRLDSHYPSLPFIDCIHLPLVPKILYFLNGLIFFSVFYSFSDRGARRGPSPVEGLGLRLMRAWKPSSLEQKLPEAEI